MDVEDWERLLFSGRYKIMKTYRVEVNYVDNVKEVFHDVYNIKDTDRKLTIRFKDTEIVFMLHYIVNYIIEED